MNIARNYPRAVTMILAVFMILSKDGYAQTQLKRNEMKEQREILGGNARIAKNQSGQVACKLTSRELQKRKQSVIADLRQQVLEKKELLNGYAYKFPGSDEVLDMLAEFIKTERACCNFFIFTLSVSGDKSEAWLSLSGAEGAKEFITAELEL